MIEDCPAPTVPVVVGSEHLVGRYEDLRCQALRGSGGGLGLALFLRRGMKVWIGAWSDCSLHAPRVRSSNEERDFVVVPPHLYSEIAIVLAGMLLNNEAER
jgi:hypothetical protein